MPVRAGRGAMLVPQAAACLAVLVVVVLTAKVGIVPAVGLGAVAAAGAVLLVIPARYRLGVVIGIAVVAGLDGLPGPDLDTTLAKFGLYDQDVVVIVLCACLAIDNLRGRFHGLLGDRLGFAIVIACLAVIVWWFVTLDRTVTQSGLTVAHSVDYGRDFLTFAVMTPLFCGSLQRKDVRDAMLATVAVSVVLIAGVYFVGALTHHVNTTLLHTTHIASAGAISRIYAWVLDLITAALPLGIGAGILGGSPRIRRLGWLVALVTLGATLVALTRARYLGSGCGVAAAACLWLLQPGSASANARRRVTRALCAGVLGVAVLLVLLPQGKAGHLLDSVSSRVGSIGPTVSSSNTNTSTVAFRLGEVTLLEQRLGDHALLGLGFINPRDQWDPSLPDGSIRNTDVGALNSVMTMGIVGTVFYYLPLVLVTIALAFWGRGRWRDDLAWLGFGAFAWCVGALVSSATVVTLFSATGVVSAAAMLGIGAAVCVRPRQRPGVRI
jgi:hypothetical protein